MQLMPWIRGGGHVFVHRSEDGGRTFSISTAVDPAPFTGGYGMRGGLVLPDGDVVLPLSDVPSYSRIFTVRSSNGGLTWESPRPAASVDGLSFEEPAPILLPDGDAVMLLRENTTRTLYLVRSSDGARTWSRPTPTGIQAYPAHIVPLPGGELLAVAGRRIEPFGIEAHLSEDRGRSFRGRVLPIRTDLPSKDLGYPTAALRSDGRLFVAYYYRDREGVTGLHATVLTI